MIHLMDLFRAVPRITKRGFDHFGNLFFCYCLQCRSGWLVWTSTAKSSPGQTRSAGRPGRNRLPPCMTWPRLSRWLPTIPTMSSSTTGAFHLSAPVSRICSSSWAICRSRRECGRSGPRPEDWRPPRVSAWSGDSIKAASRWTGMRPSRKKSQSIPHQWSSPISSSWISARGRRR